MEIKTIKNYKNLAEKLIDDPAKQPDPDWNNVDNDLKLAQEMPPKQHSFKKQLKVYIGNDIFDLINNINKDKDIVNINYIFPRQSDSAALHAIVYYEYLE